MLRWRLTLGTAIVAGLVGLCWLDARAAIPGVWLMPVAVILTVLATGETLQLMAAAGLHPERWTVYWGSLLVVATAWIAPLASYFSAEVSAAGKERLAAPAVAASWLVLVFALVALGLFAEEIRRYRAPGGAIGNLAGAVFATAYTGLLMGLLVALRMTWGVGALAALLIVVKVSDTGAYAVGRLVGRHKLAPRLSPGKTIEGTIGGLAAGCLGAWAAFHWILPAPPQWAAWLTFGLLVASAGILGDLGESLLKRDVGKKDSSAWMPGFGGVLDMIDSLLLSAPVACVYWTLYPG